MRGMSQSSKRDLLGAYPGESCKAPEISAYKIFVRFLLLVAGALVISFAAHWLLGVFHINPLGMRSIEW